MLSDLSELVEGTFVKCGLLRSGRKVIQLLVELRADEGKPAEASSRVSLQGPRVLGLWEFLSAVSELLM